jgi:hypothetical protein
MTAIAAKVLDVDHPMLITLVRNIVWSFESDSQGIEAHSAL